LLWARQKAAYVALPTFFKKRLIKNLYAGIVQYGVVGFLGVLGRRMGILDLFKGKTPQLPTAKQLEEQDKKEIELLLKEKVKLERDLENLLKFVSLDRFPGSLNEYILLKREEGLDYAHVIVPMSTGRAEKFAYDFSNSSGVTNQDFIAEENNLLLKLLNDGCIGLIRYVRSDYAPGCYLCYGIPVKIKNDNPYR